MLQHGVQVRFLFVRAVLSMYSMVKGKREYKLKQERTQEKYAPLPSCPKRHFMHAGRSRYCPMAKLTWTTTGVGKPLTFPNEDPLTFPNEDGPANNLIQSYFLAS